MRGCQLGQVQDLSTSCQETSSASFFSVFSHYSSINALHMQKNIDEYFFYLLNLCVASKKLLPSISCIKIDFRSSKNIPSRLMSFSDIRESS